MERTGSRGCYNKFSSPFTMSLGCIPSRIALVLRLLLSASCAIALHMPSGSHDSTVSGLAGCLRNATMICTTANIPEKSLMSLLEEGSHVSDMTIYNGICQVVWRADTDKLIPLFSEEILTGVGHWLNEVKYESHGKAKGPLYFWPHQNEEDLLKGDVYKINRILRMAIETLDKESENLRLAWHDEDWICLRVDNIRNDKSNLRLWIVFYRKIWPTSRDNLVLASIHGAVFNDLMKIYCNAFKTELPDVAQVPKRGSVQGWEYVLIYTPFRGFSRRDKIVNMTRARFSQEATGKVAGREDHVGAQRNIHVDELPNIPNDGSQSLAWRGRLLQAVTPNVAPITSPVVEAAPPVVTPVEAPPPITTPVKSPPPPVTTIVKSPPPPVTTPVTSPPPPIATPVTSPPPPITTPVKSPPPPITTPVSTSPPPPSMTPSPLPSESSPLLELPPPDVYTPVGTPILESPPPANAVPVSPSYSLDIPPADDIFLKPTIVSPDSWKIGNVSVYVTGVYIPFISILPSGILLMKEATRKRHRVRESHKQQYTRQIPKPIRRLFQALTPPAMMPTAMMPTEMMPPTMPPAMMPAAMTVPPPPAPPTWMPKSPGVSPYLLMFLQVDAGSLLIPLPSWLLWNAKHQPTDNDQWISLMNDSIDSFQLVPGAGIQFMGTVEQINEALLDLEFGLGLGNGKTRDVNLVVMAVHQYVNLTSIIASTAKKTIVMNVVGAGAWFIVFQYTKAFYNSAVGVLLFFAMSLILLCCILGCCMCHDTKMEKVFQANKAALKSQNLVFNETRVFNPVWIPSAVVGAGRGRFIIFHNPKFLQKRLAEHLSSLHGAVVEKVVTVTDFSKVEESLGLRDDVFGEGSENSRLSSTTQESMSPSGTSQPDDGEEGGSQSTHYTIKEDRAPGSPLSMTDISVGSGSTHYDIGSPRIASDSEETESTRG